MKNSKNEESRRETTRADVDCNDQIMKILMICLVTGEGGGKSNCKVGTRWIRLKHKQCMFSLKIPLRHNILRILIIHAHLAQRLMRFFPQIYEDEGQNPQTFSFLECVKGLFSRTRTKPSVVPLSVYDMTIPAGSVGHAHNLLPSK